MNIFSIIKNKIETSLIGLSKLDLGAINFTVEPPKDAKNGDLSTNVAMVYAKYFNLKPTILAEELSKSISQYEEVKSCIVASPGFINIILKEEVCFRILANILEQKDRFGLIDIGKKQKINIEFVSVNPTGPMHVGHARGAVFGDVLARLMSLTGYDVLKEYYINDAGNQIDILANSAYIRYLEASGEKVVEIPSGFYPGEYLIPVGEDLLQKFANRLKDLPAQERLELIKPIVIGAMMELIKEDLKMLGVSHDLFFSENSLHKNDEITTAIEILRKKNLIYHGHIDPPKGNLPDDWEDREQLLFKSTLYEDDMDRPLQKSDGTWTYFAADVAYAFNKLNRGFENITMILGADHAGYIKRTKAAIRALSDNKISSNIHIMQLVNYCKDGQPFKMSKRAGQYTSAKEVVEAVGRDVVRYIMLTRKNDMIIDFDLAKVTEQSKDTPIFYVQYANARCSSVLKNGLEIFSDIQELLQKKNYDLELLDTDIELSIIKLLSAWPRCLLQAATHQEPHRIAIYLYELASSFHSYWSIGRENKELRFILSHNKNKTVARIALTQAISVVSSGLKVFNIVPIDEM